MIFDLGKQQNCFLAGGRITFNELHNTVVFGGAGDFTSTSFLYRYAQTQCYTVVFNSFVAHPDVTANTPVRTSDSGETATTSAYLPLQGGTAQTLI